MVVFVRSFFPSFFLARTKTVQAKRWLSPATECLWAGVTCDESKNIRKVSLYGQDIRGTFPDSFANLKYVQTIGMHWNNFNGTLPENLGKMKHLIHVELHNNLFTGGFPSSWSNARNFQLLNIANNFLTGQLPATLGNFRNIKGLFLYKNQFSGTLPSELANARSLGKFHSLSAIISWWLGGCLLLLNAVVVFVDNVVDIAGCLFRGRMERSCVFLLAPPVNKQV